MPIVINSTSHLIGSHNANTHGGLSVQVAFQALSRASKSNFSGFFFSSKRTKLLSLTNFSYSYLVGKKRMQRTRQLIESSIAATHAIRELRKNNLVSSCLGTDKLKDNASLDCVAVDTYRR